MGFKIQYNRTTLTAEMIVKNYPEVTAECDDTFPRRITVKDPTTDFRCELCHQLFDMWYTDDELWQRLPNRTFNVPRYNSHDYRPGDAPVSTLAQDLVLCLPCFQRLLREIDLSKVDLRQYPQACHLYRGAA